MIQFSNQVGRLVEARLAAPFAPGEFDQFRRDMVATLAHTPGQGVGCIDVRGSLLFPPDVADAIAATMRADNSKIERSGIIFGREAMLALQVERVIRESGHPGRKVFREVDPMLEWLGEVLSPREVERAKAFLAEHP